MTKSKIKKDLINKISPELLTKGGREITTVFQGKVKVLSNKRVAPDHSILRLSAPVLARVTKPGQFIQVQVTEGIEPFLRRPFSLLDVYGDSIEILYAVVGKGTGILTKKKKGDFVDALGPLGNAWNPIGAKKRAILVGGGVGIPPLYFLAKQEKSHLRQIEVFLGAKHKPLLLCQRDFQELGVNVHVATDDGSAGFKGYVTELLKQWLELSVVSGQWSVVSRQLPVVVITYD